MLLQGGEAVKRASEVAREFGEAQLLTEENCARLCIVIEELVANLYDHGGLTDDDEVELIFGREEPGLRICITDPGEPFDPRMVPSKRAQPERGGGAGIDIVRAWTQLANYSVTRDGNRLDLLLPI